MVVICPDYDRKPWTGLEWRAIHALLGQLGAPIPDLPPYEPARDPKLPWEDEVAAAIEALRAEKAASLDKA